MARQYGNLQKLAQVFQGVVTAAAAKTAIVDARLGDFRAGIALLVVSAVGGTTPSFTVNIESSIDGVTWTVQGTFTAITANGVYFLSCDQLGPRLRANFTAATGTSPTGNFTLIAQAAETHYLPYDGVVINS